MAKGTVMPPLEDGYPIPAAPLRRKGNRGGKSLWKTLILQAEHGQSIKVMAFQVQTVCGIARRLNIETRKEKIKGEYIPYDVGIPKQPHIQYSPAYRIWFLHT